MPAAPRAADLGPTAGEHGNRRRRTKFGKQIGELACRLASLRQLPSTQALAAANATLPSRLTEGFVNGLPHRQQNSRQSLVNSAILLFFATTCATSVEKTTGKRSIPTLIRSTTVRASLPPPEPYGCGRTRRRRSSLGRSATLMSGQAVLFDLGASEVPSSSHFAKHAIRKD